MSTDADLLARHGRTKRWARAYLGGTFDCLHRGHLALFARARRLADEVVVSLNTDEFATAYKRRPLMPLADRMAVLGQIRLVDRVIVNTGDADSKPAILFSGSDLVLHGSDWIGASLMRQMGLTSEWLAEHGIDLVTVDTRVTSTTEILTAYAQQGVIRG